MIIDVEWIWRKGGPALGRVLARPMRAGGRIVSGVTSSAIAGLQSAGRQVFAAEGVVSRKLPLSGAAIWALCLLGVVLLISLFR